MPVSDRPCKLSDDRIHDIAVSGEATPEEIQELANTILYLNTCAAFDALEAKQTHRDRLLQDFRKSWDAAKSETEFLLGK